MIKHKYLEEIGVKPIQQCFLGDKPSIKEKLRYRKYIKRYKKTGVFTSVTWDMESSLFQWLYETTREYVEEASNIVDLEYHKLTYKNNTYTQLELINIFLEKLKYILTHDTDLFITLEERELIQEVYDIWGILSPTMWW